MMADNHDGIRNPRSMNRTEDTLEKCLSPEPKKSFRASPHSLGFTGCENDGADQWDNAYMKVLTAMR
jgi:hypothetical protein